MTMGDQFARAASQWDNLVTTGFKSGVKSWGTLFTDPSHSNFVHKSITLSLIFDYD